MHDEDDNIININTMAFSGSNLTAGGAAASIYTPTSTYIPHSGTTYTTMAPSYNNGIVCVGDADFKGDLKVNGKSIVETLNSIEKRLSILIPDPKKLAKYEALQKAYEHYKTLEAMCYGNDDD